MVTLRRKDVTRLLAIAALASLAGGCKFFDLSNPLLPTARLFAQASNPTTMIVAYQYSQQQNTIQPTVTLPKVTVSAYPNDASPGVTINGFSIEYFDMNGQAIPSMFLAKQNTAMTLYVPPTNATSAAAPIEVDLPIYNQQVRLFGATQAYSFAGQVGFVRNFSHVISASVTLYGQDDNLNQITVPFSVPIQFTADISS